MVKKGDSIFKSYTWHKSWVRPHESLFSVLLNFARVNVIGIHQVLSMFSRISMSEKYDLRHVILHACVKSGLNIAEECLLPKDYIYGFNGILIDKQLFYSEFEQKLRICPRCIDEWGFHSVLYQFKGIKECPIHHVPLELINEYSYNTQTRMFYFKKANEFCVLDLPLPVDRAEGFDVSNISNFYNTFNTEMRNAKYVGTFIRTSEILKSNMSLRDLKKTNLIMTVRKENIEDYKNKLVEEYIRLYISLHPDIEAKVDNPILYLANLIGDYMEVSLVEIIAYIFTMKLITECNNDSFPGKYPQPKAIGSDIYPNDHNFKRIAYAEMIRGYNEQWICSDERFVHPYSDSVRRYTKYDNLNYNIFNEYMSTGLGKLKQSVTAYLLTEAIYDLYQFQWKRFEDLIGDNEVFSKTDTCNRLPSIRYIIIEDKNDQLSLYRQVEEKL